MNKELTSLEAFNKIKFALDFIYCGELSKEKEIVRYLGIIEKALKALETIKETLGIVLYFSDYDESTKTIYIDCAIDCDKQEYDLLKEVLL